MKPCIAKPGDPRWRNPALEPRDNDPDWVAELRARCKRFSISVVAKEFGYSRKKLSGILNRAQVTPRAEGVVRIVRRHHCPHFDRLITFQDCRLYASQERTYTWPPTIAHLLSCASCSFRPKETSR